MDTAVLIKEIFEVCIIPLLGVLTSFLIVYINKKKEALKLQAKDDTQRKYLDLLADAISDSVLAVQQTYVDSLKQSGSFDAEAQKKAFQDACTNVMTVLNAEAQTILTELVGDLNTYIAIKIEAQVKANKLLPVA